MRPHLLSLIDEALGTYAADRLAVAFGGQQVSLPKRAHPDHPIAQQVGLAVLEVLVAHRGGEKVEIPMGDAGTWARARRQAADLVAAGAPVPEVVRATGMTRRTIFRIKKRRREDDAHPRLL